MCGQNLGQNAPGGGGGCKARWDNKINGAEISRRVSCEHAGKGTEGDKSKL